MNSRSFLLDMLKTTLPFVRLSLTTIATDDPRSEISTMLNKIIIEIVSELTTVIELARQEKNMQARDKIVKIRSDLITIQPKLFLSPNSQDLYQCVLNHLACLGDELYYKQFTAENRNGNIISSNL